MYLWYLSRHWLRVTGLGEGAGDGLSADTECCICMDPLTESTCRVLRTCSHALCSPCLERLQSTSHVTTCPLCRTPFKSGDVLSREDLAAAAAAQAAKQKALAAAAAAASPAVVAPTPVYVAVCVIPRCTLPSRCQFGLKRNPWGALSVPCSMQQCETRECEGRGQST